ncbi:class I SAM-dependent methyltransferase [Halorientalis pallida]|uniref:Class I SAM-dependent methyltransferase n=1 Tax=Halorientalis pallida TaxID=2479928 RepID=A0A498KRS8_9EURY|nr:class I SAM-dependent methyltransferase [Halorientalis pallida]RXK47287.1 class I SAM-dependent methyltransferase [Halorientalis pallida]
MDRREVRESWEALSETYARTRPTDGNDVALLDELVEQLPADARVLDVGCGDGQRTLANLDGTDRIGLDFARTGLDLATRNVPAARLVQGDMARLPLRAGSVDAITAYHAVFHVPQADHPEVYREFARVLRPGGLVLTTVGGSRYETVRRGWLGSDERMFFSTPGRDRTREQLEAAGFEIRWERHVDDPLGSSALFFLAELTA